MKWVKGNTLEDCVTYAHFTSDKLDITGLPGGEGAQTSEEWALEGKCPGPWRLADEASV